MAEREVIAVVTRTIIELQAKPGMRDELVRILGGVIAAMRDVPGFLSVTSYEIVEDPDRLVEIAEWESPEAAQRWLDRVQESGDLGSVMEALGTLFRATNVRQTGIVSAPNRRETSTKRSQKGYVLAGVVGAAVGGLVALAVTRAIPVMMSEMMSGMMGTMMAQMGETGCSPADM
jgi:quinol monooxygenase YgiN